jgi:SAM-dependent methyltransferase
LLTVDFAKFPINPGDRVLDLGCGAGRHAFEAYRRGARVIAADLDLKELAPVSDMFAAMRAEAEMLEHIPNDAAALKEIARVLRPGGTVAVTVPAWLPERVCWALSSEYHEVPGGHVRIFTRAELSAKLTAAGLTPTGGHHAHGLHSPYWWLKCAVGVQDDAHPAVRGYHRLLVWDIMRKPALTRVTEAALNPVIGKSLVIYAKKKEETPVIPNARVVSPGSRASTRPPAPREAGAASPRDDGRADAAD